MKLLYKCLVLIGVMVSLPSLAQEFREYANKPSYPELIMSVDEEEARGVLDELQQDIKDHLYFAKRYRITKINLDLLKKPADHFVVTPFAGEWVPYYSDGLEVLSPKMSVWKGAVDYEVLVGKNVEIEEEHKQLIEDTSKLSIVIATMPYQPGDDNVRTTAVGSSVSSAEAVRSAHAEIIEARFPSIARNKVFQISVVPTNPNYYIVSEIDIKKELWDGNSPEAQRRRNEFQEFREQPATVKNQQLLNRRGESEQ